MSREMEDRLRAAYQAKADQVTDRRLAQLRAERASQLATLLSEDVPIARLEHPPVQLDSRRHRHSRWFAPAVAAAAVAAVAAAAFALSTPGPHRVTPAPPATRISSPTGSASPSATGSPSATASSSTSTGPAYLPAGRTGTRDDVPWAQVGTGWRLVQPMVFGASPGPLYLYDPAGGRYLITDQLPSSANLKAWSPDGQRAMFQSGEGNYARFQQLDLRSGQLNAGFTQYLGSFVSYTQPRGLAVLVEGEVQGAPRLLRYDPDGSLQLAYPPELVGGGPLTSTALYSADGSQFVAYTGHSELVSNGGQLIRQYPLPQSDDQLCQPLRWWTSDSFLEACDTPTGGAWPNTLYLQPVAGGAPSRLAPQSATSPDYDYAWPLSNGDVLLQRAAGCGVSNYDILRPDGTIVPLRLPAGVTDPTTIVSMTGDLAVFRTLKQDNCGGGAPEDALIEYNMITGATSTLLPGIGTAVDYPGG